MMTILLLKVIIESVLVLERRGVAMFKQALEFFRKTWVQLRNPYRPERRYMRGSQQARSSK